MEEAYSELYKEFLRLRSLCLKQAALLHQLATALQKQQAAALPNGDGGDMMSIPVQCTQEIPACLLENPQPLTATAHSAAAQCCVFDRLSRNVGTFSDLLAEDMSKLCMEGPHRTKVKQESGQSVAPLLTVDSSMWQGASSNASGNALQADYLCGDVAMRTVRMLATDRPSLPADLRTLSDGMLMSDVALQSNVCEFCQAAFPGDTTTRGEFLRHLYTHIT
ncbi:uncharacterized protein AB9X84_009875 isoform 1-T9 [Acanthopagrus schlegelii]